MKSIIIGPSDKNRTVTPQMLQRVKAGMPKPSDDKSQVCNVLRQSRGGYTHRRYRAAKYA
ncbi:hypothetical protein ACFO1V_04910 [Daeguia caeni]|uniref:Uncharacterized protein n=1 Tax=Daeguia caeni TaxID=439612 RepID=A0ABV9H4F2_9HYPH